MKRILKGIMVVSALSLAPLASQANTESMAREKIEQLQQLMKEAEAKGLDTQREECAVWMADAFLGYAAWDEQNIDLNTYQYATWASFKDNAKQLAEELPEFERAEVEKMLDTAIEELTAVMSGEVLRPTPAPTDWHGIKAEGDSFMSYGTPTFVNMNNRFPKETASPYNGLIDRAGLGLDMTNDKGEVSKEVIKAQKKRAKSYSGDVFLGHGVPPQWMREKDPTVMDGARLFVRYDIDNPLIRSTWERVIKTIVPYYAEHPSSNYGYLLANEPHWLMMKNQWAAGTLSEHGFAKFRKWLENKHQSIARLNELWGTSFASFEDVEVEVPFEGELYGTPMIYDLSRFNEDRVVEWFTFLADNIRKYDSDAKIHIKVMPNLFSMDRRDTGLDFERLTELSDIIGNDAAIQGRSVNSKFPEEWETNYAFEWDEVGYTYDFMHSVSPDKSNLNSESHYLSTVHFRDRELSKEYTRASYWFATMQGMDVSFSWFWARSADGAIHPSLRAGVSQSDNAMAKAYVASLCQQPRVTNEIAKTYMDMNCFGEELTAIQRLRRPIRIYYSEHTALNRMDYVEHQKQLHRDLFFEGAPVGFATESIIKKQDNSAWDVILVKGTQFVEQSEIEALQSYLDRGGVVIIDNISLKMNEYGEPQSKSLRASKGQLIRCATDEQFVARGLSIAEESGSMPSLVVTERNNCPSKGCVWRVVSKDGKDVVSIVNIGASEATVSLSRRDGAALGTMTNMLTGEKIMNGFKMKPYDVLMIETK